MFTHPVEFIRVIGITPTRKRVTLVAPSAAAVTAATEIVMRTASLRSDSSSEIVVEDQSRNTEQNIDFAPPLARSVGPIKIGRLFKTL